MLGQGAYAMVREAIHIQTGHLVAIKIYDKYKLISNTAVKKCVTREIENLTRLSSIKSNENDFSPTSYGHPSIMKLYDAIESSRQIYLIVERCEGKMLHTVIKEMTAMGSSRKNLSEQHCAKILFQIMQGLSFIHSNNISHRDIKVENILVNSAEESMPTKLIDFGFAHMTESPDQRLTAFCGTPAYMSPQMAAKQEYLGPPVDIWATGVLFFQILFGYQPFKSSNEKDLLKKIQKGKVDFPKSTQGDLELQNQKTQNLNVQNQLSMKDPSAASSKRVSKRGTQQVLNPPPLVGKVNSEDPMFTSINYSNEAKSVIKDLLTVSEEERITADQVLTKYSNWFNLHEAVPND